MINDRVQKHLGIWGLSFPHFIGTFDSWIHGYIVQPFSHKTLSDSDSQIDQSIRIVDEGSTADFLDNYLTPYQYNRTGKVKANQYYFDIGSGRIIFSSGNRNRSIDKIRNEIVLEEWQITNLRSLKKRFLKAGFATYADMENICYNILTSCGVCNQICRRFPVIVIDECQDLSSRQLMILAELIKNGMVVHLIGDLNQSIYGFKDGLPENVEGFLADHQFTKKVLSYNFRSSPPIVEVCNGLVENSIAEGNDERLIPEPCVCIVFPRNRISEIPMKFKEYIQSKDEYQISLSKSAILARNHSIIEKLRNVKSSYDKSVYYLPFAVQMWPSSSKIPLEQLSELLDLFGFFLSRHVIHGCHYNSNQQYRPEFINSSTLWRQILVNILQDVTDDSNLNSLDVTWSIYSRRVRENLGIYIKDKLREIGVDLPLEVEVDVKFRAPSGEARNIVSSTIPAVYLDNFQGIRITTIHQAKGETLDAALLAFSPNNRGGGGGYWENWFENQDDEIARFAYVASSRPKYLLMWAVPEETINEM
ncbi:MAG: UvrD-helicase domain-containing protein, partial [Thermotogota bacterium]|nr:UvrD-helicase domain-containing protein [Thermotogota bacterium]